MTKLRDKTHIVLFLLLAAFLLLIVFEWGMNYTGPSRKAGIAGKVNGKPIPAAQYDEVYKGLSENFRRNNPGVDLTSQMEMGFREQAWTIVVDQMLVEELFEKYGIKAGDQEVLNSVNSTVNPPMIIRQNFTDPRTGVIDRQKLDKARSAPENKEFWVKVEQVVQRELKVDKLLRALQTMVQVSDADAGDLVLRQFSRFTASFIPVPLSYAGADNLFPVKGSEVTAYYNEHKEQFRQDPTRSAEYVFSPLTPSSEDSLQVRKDIEALRDGFAGAPSDSDFVRIQSDRPNAVNVVYSRADFSPAAGEAVFGSPKLAPGQIIGPIADRGLYRLLKIRQTGTGPAVAKASHILVRYNPADRNDTQRALGVVSSIFRQLKDGVSFEALAATYSQDQGSAKNGGQLGWFSKARMVPEFAEAVFASQPGQIIGPVRTQFGLHIIKVDGFDQAQILCSEVAREIRASTETTEAIRRKAMVFQKDAREKGFEKTSRLEGLAVGKTGEFSKRSLIPQIGFNDKINQFAFGAKEGDVSGLIETEQGFYVMRLLSKNDTGYRQLDKDLKQMITAELVRGKKGDAVKSRLAALAGAQAPSLDAVISRDSRLTKITSDEIRWSDGYIAGYGYDPQLVEAMSGMKLNRVSGPVKTADGYALVVLTGKTVAEGVDQQAEKLRIFPQLLKAKQEQFFAEYFGAVRKNATIEDYRQ
jgi:parvulin-like peptidyl-prolyl isomerase